MLSDKFKQLLDIQEERLSVIRADCAPFAGDQDAPQKVHQRIVDDIDRIIDLTRAFRAATPTTAQDKQNVLQTYGQSSKISMELSGFIFQNSHCSGAFRHAALQKHGALVHVIAREQVTTCVNMGWALIEDILAASRKRTSETGPIVASADTAADTADIPYTPAPMDQAALDRTSLYSQDGNIYTLRPRNKDKNGPRPE